MKHTLVFLATLLLVPIAAWSADTPQKETGLGYAVASQLEEFLGEPLFVPMQQLWEKRGGWGGVLTAKDGTVVAFQSPVLSPVENGGVIRGKARVKMAAHM